MTLHVGTPPQTEEEIAPIRDALRLRCNDPLLDLRWNATAVMVKHGGYDVVGNILRPEYEGRWQVVRYATDRLHLDREFAVICTVTKPDLVSERYPIMRDQGEYTPIDWWLVEYMQLWDRANSRYAEEASKRAWAEHDAAEALPDDRAAHQEALEKVYREHGSEYWMGGAQGKADAVTVESLWGSKHSNN